MDGDRRANSQVARKRFEVLQMLWEQGYGRRRMLMFALHNQLFDPSQLEAANTPEGQAELLTIIGKEFRLIERAKTEERRERIMQMLALGLSAREMTQQCVEMKLVHNADPTPAYHTVRKDRIRVVKQMRAQDLEYIPVAKSIYVRQQNRIFREAMARHAAAAQEGDNRGSSAQLLVAMKASQNIAIVNKVDVNGRLQEVQKGFDLATEAALAIIEQTNAISAGHTLPPVGDVAEPDELEVIDVEPIRTSAVDEAGA